MMSPMRIALLALALTFVAACAGTTAGSPSPTPLATSTTSASTAPTASAAATQATTNAALACTAPAAPLVFPGVSQNASDSIYSAQMLVKLNTATSPVTGTFTFVVNVA